MPDKRILILYNRVPFPLNDGGNIAVHAMVQGYKMQGWKVYVLAMNTSRHRVADEVLSNIYTDIYKFETVDVNNEVKPVHTIKNYLFSSKPNHAERFNRPDFADKLMNAIKEFQPNVIQLESVFLASYLPLMRSHSKAKMVLRMHNIEGQVWERLASETRGLFKRRYLQNLARRIKQYEEKAWNEFDLLLPITSVDASYLESIGIRTQAFTVPVGIAATDIISDKTHEKWIGYHIGAMDWLPNKEAIAWFIKDIWPSIHNAVPEFTFQFAGRNMPASISLMHADGVLCVGEVSDAAAFIADKKILIVPLRAGGGIRVKILEAMAAGKLVISTHVGMQGIDAVAGTHYLLADDATSFTNAVYWVYHHKHEAEHMAEEGSKLVRDKYDAAKLAHGLSDYLVQCIAPHRFS